METTEIGPGTRRISIPDGRTASAEEMRFCGRALQQFVRETEARLGHLTDVKQYNRGVEFLRAVAGRYNAELRVFREAEQRRILERQALWAKLLAQSVGPEQRRTRH